VGGFYAVMGGGFVVGDRALGGGSGGGSGCGGNTYGLVGGGGLKSL
jgi:hypothetical protein